MKFAKVPSNSDFPGSKANSEQPARMTSTATATVLAIPELLENILLHVNMRRLFTLQRINCTSHDVIASSKALRRILSLEYSMPGRTEHHPILNTLFVESDEILFPVKFTGDGEMQLTFDLCGEWSQFFPDELFSSEDLSSWPLTANGSWRATKIFSQPNPFALRLHCQARPELQGFTWSDGTTSSRLGDLADAQANLVTEMMKDLLGQIETPDSLIPKVIARLERVKSVKSTVWLVENGRAPDELATRHTARLRGPSRQREV